VEDAMAEDTERLPLSDEQLVERLKWFETAARRVGERFEELGLTEEEVMDQLEETKRQVYEEQYGKAQP
jgi:hypothetical protein